MTTKKNKTNLITITAIASISLILLSVAVIATELSQAEDTSLQSEDLIENCNNPNSCTSAKNCGSPTCGIVTGESIDCNCGK